MSTRRISVFFGRLGLKFVFAVVETFAGNGERKRLLKFQTDPTSPSGGGAWPTRAAVRGGA